ncbi:MAG: ATP-binding protein [Candidatus Aenigmarchaeota archaeon]|nr:ATP-binding protein [Candidatus Aenigmarchaeota archaeon]
MDAEKLKLLIEEFHETELPSVIERRLIDIDLDTKKIVAVFGPRRSGKTYYFYYLIKKLISQGLEKTRLLYINFEDDRILPFSVEDFEKLVETYYELYPQNKSKEVFMFLDEIQNIDGWEIAIRRIYDKERVRIFITGSSSKLLSKEIATALRGRTISYEMLPFSFEELLAARGIDAKNVFYSKSRFDAKHALDEYMKFGGFPEVIMQKNENTKIRILQEYMNVVFYRDLIERFSIKNKVLIKEMLRYAISNISNYFSLSGFYKLAKEKHGITKKTVLDYAGYMEDIGIIFFVSKFSSSLKEQMRNPRKIYIVDTGFRTAHGFFLTEDYGKIMENLVFLKLKHIKMKNPLIEIFYWKDKETDIDFLIKEGRHIKNIMQVCWNINKKETKDRETQSMVKALKKFDLKEGVIVTKDSETKERIGGKTVHYVPLWKFLLKNYSETMK